MTMRNHSKTIINIILFMTIAFLFSCEKESVPEIKLENEKYGRFNGFEIKKVHNNRYKIDLGKSEKELFLSFEGDTVFLSFGKMNINNKHSFFVRNNFRQEKKIILFEEVESYDSVILSRKPMITYEGICNSDLIFTNKNGESEGYSLWYSFEKGIIQILTKNPVNIEVLSLYPTIDYKIMANKKDILSL